VLLKVLEIIDRHGAQVAFPTSTLHVPDGIAVRQEDEAARKAHEAAGAHRAVDRGSDT